MSSVIKEMPFRYAGIQRDYDKSYGEITGDEEAQCYKCKGYMEEHVKGYPKIKPYAAIFKYTKGMSKDLYHFKPLCRTCAYEYGMGVIEMDGEIYYSEDDFEEEDYKVEIGYGKI